MANKCPQLSHFQISVALIFYYKNRRSLIIINEKSFPKNIKFQKPLFMKRLEPSSNYQVSVAIILFFFFFF